MNFELYKNVCTNCLHEFSTLNLPSHMISKVYAATEAYEVILLIPEQSREWQEIINLVQVTLLQLDMDQQLEALVIEAVVNHAFDYSGEGLRYYLWGNLPCPQCYTKQRRFVGPYRPPVHREINTRVARFTTWQDMPADEKQHVTIEIARRIQQQQLSLSTD